MRRRVDPIQPRDSKAGALEECLLATFFSTQALDAEVLEEVRMEADKDLQANKARQLPEVLQAREKAEEFGLLGAQQTEQEQISAAKLLAQAIGTEPSFSRGHDHNDISKRPSCVGETASLFSGEHLLEKLTQELNSWKNKKLRFNARSRHTTRTQKTEIFRRDGWRCRTPGCPHQAWLEVHHLKPYSEGELCSNLVFEGLNSVFGVLSRGLIFPYFFCQWWTVQTELSRSRIIRSGLRCLA